MTMLTATLLLFVPFRLGRMVGLDGMDVVYFVFEVFYGLLLLRVRCSRQQRQRLCHGCLSL